MKTKLIIIALISVLTIACKKEKNTVQIAPKVEEQVVQEEAHHHKNDAIVFNNGNKWKVVDHMMAHIKNMEKDVSNFNGKSVADYKLLSDKLNKNIELLTSNCTMTGQAHDELHKWLLPYIELTNQFKDVKTLSNAKLKYQEIQKSFEMLNKFFE